MRTIKFRGKSLTNGKWVCGDSIKHTENASENGTEVLTYIGWRVENARKVGAIKWIPVAPDTVGQFTGLLDRNGKEIYEGDILKGTSYLYGYDLPNGKQFDYEGFVEWLSQCDVGLCWGLTALDQSGSWLLNQTAHRNFIDYSTGIIIGNIHDNPELLKVQE